MMSSSKQPGTLRDFNISGQFNGPSATSSHSAAKPAPSSAPKSVTGTVPSQTVKNRATPTAARHVQSPTPARKPNLTEWEDPDKFWSSWEKDLESPDITRRPQPQLMASSPIPKPAAVAVKSITAPIAKAATAQPANSKPESAPGRSGVGVAQGVVPLRASQMVQQQASAPTSTANMPVLTNLNDTRNANAPVELDEVQGQLQTEETGSTPWAVEIAVQERRAERMGVVDFANAYQKQELLKKMTLEFMASLRKTFQEQIEVFNESRRNPAQNVQLYRVSNTAEDFMIFRNSVKLVVSGQRAGRIVFGFNQFLGQIFAPRAPNTFEIEASWGAFDQLAWNYRGERVQTAEIVRYFLTEFSRQSFR